MKVILVALRKLYMSLNQADFSSGLSCHNFYPEQSAPRSPAGYVVYMAHLAAWLYWHSLPTQAMSLLTDLFLVVGRLGGSGVRSLRNESRRQQVDLVLFTH